jgi:hypothetical protein
MHSAVREIRTAVEVTTLPLEQVIGEVLDEPTITGRA